MTRLWNVHAADLLARNTVVSCACFLFGLALLWLLIRLAGVEKYAATATAFVVATSGHYAVARLWIFRGSARGLATGYVFFLVNAVVGLVSTMLFFAAFVELLGMNFLVARVVASVFAGLAAFLLNAVLNFKSV